MPHYLATDGTDDYVQLSSLVSIGAGQNYRIEIDFECADNDAFGVRLLGIPGSDINRLIIFDGVSANVVFTPLATKSTGLPVDALNRHNWAFYRENGTTNKVSVDGVESTTAVNENSIGFGFEWLLTQRTATNSRNATNLYRCKVWIDGVLAHDWNPSNRTLGATTLVDEVGGNHGTLVNGGTFVSYGEPEPPSGTTYDAGGVSAMLMSSVGGVSVTASAGGASSVTLSASGGASLTAAAGGASAMVMTATGGAEVGSEITAGGVSAMTMTATGGATVTARAGGAYQFTFSATGGAALSAGVGGTSHAAMSATGGVSLVAVAGGMSAMTMTAAGGGVVNEQVVTVNRVTLPAAQLLTTMVLPPVAMLQSVSIQGQYNYRRTL